MNPMFDMTEEQRRDHKLRMTEVFLTAMGDRRPIGVVRIVTHAGTYVTDPYGATCEVLEKRNVKPAFTREETAELARWLNAEKNYEGEIDLTKADDDMPFIEKEADVTMLNALKIAMWMTSQHPTKQVMSPAIQFNNELKESLEPSPDGMGNRLKPESRMGRMSATEYNRARQLVVGTSTFWDDETNCAFEVAQNILSELGPRFRINLDREPLRSQNSRQASYWGRRIYANGILSRSDIASFDDNNNTVIPNHALDTDLVRIFKERADDFARDARHFSVDGQTLRSADEESIYIDAERSEVTDEFYKFLLSCASWNGLAYGAIEDELAKMLSDTTD